MSAQGITYQVGISGLSEAAARIQGFIASINRGMRPLTLPVGGVLAGLRGIESGLFGALRMATGLQAKLVALTGGISLGYIAREAFSAASGMETLTAQFFTLLKNRQAAKDMMADLMDFADVTPFTPQAVAAGGAQLLGAGFDPESVKDLLRDVGDLASGAQKPLDQVAATFGRLRSGAFGEAFQALRQQFLLSQSDLEGAGLKFDRSGSFVGSADEAITKVRKIVQEKFGGSMEEQSKTWAGKMSTLQGYVQKLWANLGAPIQDALKPWLDRSIAAVKALSDRASDLGRSIARALGTALKIFEAGKAGEAVELSLTIASRRAGAALQSSLATALQTAFSSDFVLAAVASFQSLGYHLTAIIMEALAKPIAYFQAGIQTAMELAANPKAAALMGEVALRKRNIEVEEREVASGGWFAGAAARKLPGLREALAAKEAELEGIQKSSFQANLENAMADGPRIWTPSGEKSAADLRADAEASAAGANTMWDKIGQSFSENLQKRLNDTLGKDTDLSSAQARLSKLFAAFMPGPTQLTEEEQRSRQKSNPGSSLAEAIGPASRTQADRLAQIGLFVGSSRPDSERYAQATARHTAATAKNTEKLLLKAFNPTPSGIFQEA